MKQRQWKRRPYPGYLVAFEQIAVRGHGDLLNMSAGGLAMKTIEDVEPGAITLRLKLPAQPGRATFHGEVVWVDRDAFTCGVRFHIPA